MDKEDALRVYNRLDSIEQLVAVIKTMLEERKHECDKQQVMVDELRKRVTSLEQKHAQGSGGVTVLSWAFGAVMTLISVALSLYVVASK